MAAEGPVVLPLPDLPASQQGASTASTKDFTATVSNAAGYLCHIHVDCRFDVPPQVIFAIFCHPDNAGAFRDIKHVGYRKVKASSPGLKLVEVEQWGELRVLWVTRAFKTYLDVEEDSRAPDALRTSFALLRSDILSRFNGSWELRPISDAAGAVVGCHAVLQQDVLPRGVPSFFAHLPVLGGLLRRVSLNAIQRLLEDMRTIVDRYKKAGGQLSVGDVMTAIAAERGHVTREEEDRPGSSGGGNSNSHVTSFAIDDDSFSSSGGSSSEADEDAAEQQQQQQSTAPEAAAEQERGVGASAGGAAGVSVLAAAAAGAAAAAAAAAGGDDRGGRRRHQHHKHHREGSGAEAPLLGVLLDVTVHGHVHVDLVANPDAAA